MPRQSHRLSGASVVRVAGVDYPLRGNFTIPTSIPELDYVPVSFTNIPRQWRQPLYWAEVDRSVAGPGYETKSMTASWEQEDCGDYCNELRILPNSISERPLIGRDAERALCLMEHQGMTEEEAYAQVSHWAITDATNSRLVADGSVTAIADAELNLDNPTPESILRFARRIRLMHNNGELSGLRNSPSFQRAIRTYQEWFALPVDGIAGSQVIQSAERTVRTYDRLDDNMRLHIDQLGRPPTADDIRDAAMRAAPQAYQDNVIVERDPDDPNRLNVLYPPDLVNQLRTFAALGHTRLQLDRVMNEDDPEPALQYDQERRTVGPTDDRGSRTFQNLEYIRDHGLQAPMELSLFCREIEVLRSPIELHIGRTHELRSTACSTTSCLIDSWAVYPAGSAVDAVPIAAGDFAHARALTTGDSITWSMNINIDHSDHPRQRGQVGRLTAINGQDHVHGFTDLDEPVE